MTTITKKGITFSKKTIEENIVNIKTELGKLNNAITKLVSERQRLGGQLEFFESILGDIETAKK